MVSSVIVDWGPPDATRPANPEVPALPPAKSFLLSRDFTHCCTAQNQL